MPNLDIPLLTASSSALVESFGDDIQIVDLYSDGADLYDALANNDESELRELLEQTRHLNGAVLDLGCGSGRLALPFATRNRKVVALDNSPAMLDLLARRVSLLPTRVHSLIKPVLADMTSSELVGECFDVIILGTSNITLLDPATRRKFFSSIRGNLNPQGLLFITLLNIRSMKDRSEQVRIVPTIDLNGDRWITTIMEEFEPDSLNRLIVILAQCVSDRQRPIRLLCSRPGVVDEKDVLDDIYAAGFRLTRRQELDRPEPDREVVLLTFMGDS